MPNDLTSLSFVRDGGLVAFGNPPGGEVTLNGPVAMLRSEAAPGERTLGDAERAMLGGLDPIRLRAWHPPESSLRDAITDTVTLRFQNGPPVTLTFTDPPGPAAPGTQALAEWVRKEITAIMHRRLGS